MTPPVLYLIVLDNGEPLDANHPFVANNATHGVFIPSVSRWECHTSLKLRMTPPVLCLVVLDNGESLDAIQLFIADNVFILDNSCFCTIIFV